MDADFPIRHAEERDIAAVTAIYAESVTNGTASYELTPPDLAEMTGRWRAIVAAGYPYIVAERGGTVLAYAYASAFRTRPAYRYLVEDSVYVAAELRRAGIGSRLLERLIAECEAGPWRQMVAVIGDGERQHGSIRLHERYGFRHVGRMSATGYKFGRWLDTVIMQRPLGPGATSDPPA